MAGGMSFDTIRFIGLSPPQQMVEEQELYGLVLAAGNSRKEHGNVVVLPGTVKPARSRSDFGDLSGCSQGRRTSLAASSRHS